MSRNAATERDVADIVRGAAQGTPRGAAAPRRERGCADTAARQPPADAARRVVCVVGPTASGKTTLAAALALRLGAEVIGGDSMQIYSKLDIGTAKPRTAETQGVPHHLVSIAEPSEVYSVARYVEEAERVYEDITSRGKAVIVAGGTGLYIDAFVKGLGFANVEKCDILRSRLSSLYDRFGGARLLRVLAQRDVAAAQRIHPSDKKRLVRALEVSFSGTSISEHDASTQSQPPRHDALYIGLDFADRAALYKRCDARVDAMLAQGLLDEARLVFDHRDEWRTAAQAIGYKELFPAMERPELLGECTETLKRATRRYAKRQLTWWRRNNAIHWFYPDLETFSDITDKATQIAQDFL